MKKPEEIYEECEDLLDQLYDKMEELRKAEPDKDHGIIASIVFDKGDTVNALRYTNGNGIAVYNMLNHMVNDDGRVAQMLKQVIMNYSLRLINQDQ